MEKPQQHPSSPPGHPPGEACAVTMATEAVAVARRRALLKAVVSAPVVLGVSPAGAVAAQGSAYRAAMTDAGQLPPGVPVGAADTWIRRQIPYGTLTVTAPDGAVTTVQGAYEITSTGGGSAVYYQATGGLTGPGTLIVIPFGAQTSFVPSSTESPQWVLVLFDNTAEYKEAGVWPQAAPNGTTIQGLHCSSWSSLGIPGNYSCTVTGVG